MSRAKQIIEAESDMLPPEEQQSRFGHLDKMKGLMARRSELHGEQTARIELERRLAEMGYDISSVKNWDVRDGYLVGFWLNKSNYGDKLRANSRKIEKSPSAGNDEVSKKYGKWWADDDEGPKFKSAAQSHSADYRTIDPPMYWRRR